MAYSYLDERERDNSEDPSYLAYLARQKAKAKANIIEKAGLTGLLVAGYDIDVEVETGEILEICKVVRRSVHTARRDHKDGRVKAGQTYRKITFRYIDPVTRKSSHHHSNCVIRNFV